MWNTEKVTYRDDTSKRIGDVLSGDVDGGVAESLDTADSGLHSGGNFRDDGGEDVGGGVGGSDEG